MHIAIVTIMHMDVCNTFYTLTLHACYWWVFDALQLLVDASVSSTYTMRLTKTKSKH